ncbi:hypothetical protein VIGAN_08190100 [Vigna angularis var. angularis]|uniref:Uncharacterized protein n=1 Tax=Vigna angularis var. angularis TaxID=157739 RepID=A0A0S3SQV8_PHAAN|nr:hypothetical protein VIGAN_08190100 [Vigna angularis var. angularis]
MCLPSSSHLLSATASSRFQPLILNSTVSIEPSFLGFKIGLQNITFGVKFNAKGIVDCYEKELETLPTGIKREIEFKMIEGIFNSLKENGIFFREAMDVCCRFEKQWMKIL